MNIVRKLCDGFDHVRVDLYDIEGRIYFGEMTFTPASGYCKWYPDKYDFEIGKLWNLELK